MLMAQVWPFICATCTPGTIRSRSGMLVAPDVRMSSWLMTNMAAPADETFCSRLETDVT